MANVVTIGSGALHGGVTHRIEYEQSTRTGKWVWLCSCGVDGEANYEHELIEDGGVFNQHVFGTSKRLVVDGSQ